DNRATLYGMKARGATARGVAVIDDKTPESELEALHAAGVRGIRLGFRMAFINDPTHVKLSGAYRASKKGPDYADVVPLAKALIAANPDRIVWGTDWPHPNAEQPGKKPTDITPDYPIDDGIILNLLPIGAPDAAIREKILVANPARLYGF